MEREPKEIAAQRRVLGQLLAANRQLANLTQAQLARQLYCHRTVIVRLEAGQRSKDRTFWQRADDELNAGGALIAALAELETLTANYERRIRDSEIAAARRTIAAWRQRPAVTPVHDLDGATHDLVSRSPTRAATSVELTTRADLAAIKAMAAGYRTADRQVGGGKLYNNVLSYLRAEISPRLLEPANGSTCRHLFAAAASLTEMAGWMAHDNGRDQHARNHLDQAYRLASAAGHPSVTANVCASMSHLARQLEAPTDAVRIAEAGLRHATHAPARHRLSARLHAMRARSLATVGSTRECRAALTTAEEALNRVDGDGLGEWISPFDEGALASEAALCLSELGDLRAAEAQARRVLELRVDDRVRSRAFGQLTLAQILVQADEVEEAAALGGQVTALATSLASARVLARLDDLAEALQPYASLAGVAEFLADYDHAQGNAAGSGEDTWPV
ncbi:helix-turn-helix transcriptional regulator [Amycolatopsis sp. K13G38]|uniref:Helix-turn-helix transcriptional regulator n=1 Tax=Amycolatopsis acididurans TaxID=2724524 RepID=A0ABX1IWZ4_9PSEU|nr:helix-turn-helix transcriptional regulator [Amycolatopsis acididurans]NKQ51973.1 helix-turn-helix transcriptional regulator [Amycolatopsis acididurans]